MRFRTLLCVPPDYDHNFPPLGTPALTAFLKKHGYHCEQVDLNIAYRDFLIARIDGCPMPGHDDKKVLLKPLAKKFFSGNLKGRYYSDLLPGRAGDIADIPYGNNTNSSFHFCERLLSSEYLWRYLEDRDENIFYRFYEDNGILGRLSQDDIKLLGISIISPTQAVASLTLGMLVKRMLPRIHVTIGGQWVTLYRNEILRRKDLFRAFDSAVAFEGETALYALARLLEAGRDIRSVPNIILKDTTSDVAAERFEERMDTVPCPDFDGLPLKKYDGCNGRFSLTYESSRGCYWSRCAYCVDLPLPKPSYRRKDPRLVADGMEEMARKYGPSLLMFGDPAASPRHLLELSRCLIDRRLDIEWWAFARLDPGFDRRIFDLAYKAGLRQLNFGFESANDRICSLLNKGNYKERSSRIIKACAEAGIKVDLQTMVGLPDESFDEALDTVDFLVSHKKYISHVTFNTYYLTPFNRIHADPLKYGVVFDDDQALPFRFFIPFRHKRGMDADRSEIIKKIHHSLLASSDSGNKKSFEGRAMPTERRASIYMNGERCELRYRYDARSDMYTFLEENAMEPV